MPDFKMHFDSYIYSIKADRYFYLNKEQKECQFLLSATTDQTIFGTPFLNYYYQVYDLRRNQIGLVPSIYSNPTDDQLTVEIAKKVNEELVKTLVILALIIGICFTFVFRKLQVSAETKKRKTRDNVQSGTTKKQAAEVDVHDQQYDEPLIIETKIQ